MAQVVQRRSLITGITGQDGSYLAEFLLEKGYHVVGMVRRSSTESFERIAHLRERIDIREGDLLDQLSLITLLHHVDPHEIYNLAAQSFVPTSWEQPILTSEVTALGATRLLEAIRVVDRSIKFYQASSSEMFGKVRETPQSELTPFHPRSPYVVASGQTHSVRELCEIAFAHAELDWQKYVVVDPAFVRPAEVDLLIGDASKARRVLGWAPKHSFQQLIEMMVDADLEDIKER